MEEEPEIADDPFKNYLCLSIDYRPERLVHCAFYVQEKRLLQVCEFVDNEHFSSLESLLIQLNPKESSVVFKLLIYMPELETQQDKLKEKLEDIDYSEVKGRSKGSYEPTLQFLLKQPLKHYVKETSSSQNMAVLHRLIEQLKLDSDATNKGRLHLQMLNLQQFMRLDYSAVQALQIFPKKMQKRVIATNETLFDILNRCKTSIGTRCLKRWMKQPLQDRDAIERRLQFLDYFLEQSDIRKFIQSEVLNRICDLDKLYFTFYKVHSDKPTKCEMSDLLRLYKLIKALNDFKRKLENRKLDEFARQNIYSKIESTVGELEKPATMIENNIVMEGTEHEYYIKPTTQANLKKLMKEKDQLVAEVKEEFQEVKEDLRIPMELATSTGQLHLFEGDKGCISDAIRSNNRYRMMSIRGKKATFTSIRLTDLCGELNRINEEYRKEEKEVLKRMFKVIATYYDVLEGLSLFLSELDVLTTFATIIAIDPNKWVRPKLGTKLEGTGMVHPCVSECVPNNVDMSSAKTIVITGPNMGGKSTFIRTIGVCTYLAHIGFFVPARHFETPIIDAIITRVGASDVQLKGISTFMSEMLETACMLKTATPYSLVLIDELGRGTSTHEGFGIAWAICEHLHRRINPYCLFATHFHEMTKMPEEIPGVVNMCATCRLEKNQLKMEYKIEPGQISRSYGIDLADSIGLPREVIDNARKYAVGLEKFEDEVVHSQSRKMEVEPDARDKYSLSYETKLRMLNYVREMKERHGVADKLPPAIFEEVRAELLRMKLQDAQ